MFLRIDAAWERTKWHPTLNLSGSCSNQIKFSALNATFIYMSTLFDWHASCSAPVSSLIVMFYLNDSIVSSTIPSIYHQVPDSPRDWYYLLIVGTWRRLVVSSAPSTGFLDRIANCFPSQVPWSRLVTNNSAGQQLGPMENVNQPG